MPASVQAYGAYKQADLDALKMRFRARARLGAVILRERTAKNATQDDVAAELGVVVNQVRRYEAAARQWAREYPDEPLED
jgi:thioredoxin-like negative regulator of GroEL